MTNNEVTTLKPKETTMENDIIKSVEADFKKAQAESLKAKAKDILKEKAEAEKTIKLCDMKLKKLFDDAEAGIA